MKINVVWLGMYGYPIVHIYVRMYVWMYTISYMICTIINKRTVFWLLRVTVIQGTEVMPSFKSLAQQGWILQTFDGQN